MMKLTLGIILGVCFGAALTVSAQFFSSTDSKGNMTNGYTDKHGNTSWSDNQGNFGTITQMPEHGAVVLPRSPC